MVYLLCPALLLLMSGCESEVFLSGQPEEGNSSDGKVRVEIFARANAYPLPLTKGLEDENTVGMAADIGKPTTVFLLWRCRHCIFVYIRKFPIEYDPGGNDFV